MPLARPIQNIRVLCAVQQTNHMREDCRVDADQPAGGIKQGPPPFDASTRPAVGPTVIQRKHCFRASTFAARSGSISS